MTIHRHLHALQPELVMRAPKSSIGVVVAIGSTMLATARAIRRNWARGRAAAAR
jgi:hypothetical protein